ncbi:MAG: serine/threonine protein kinase [Deltaproteobacteria bacterium]|nr:serine/threonine protein kinase [Deltaproteobacteria bacterium]
MSYSHFPVRFGKYILLDRINSGGMAEVYRAKVTGAESFERLVAIKCMLPQLNEDQQFTTMFIDEAKLASQLSHANIVQIYELGRINDNLYIAMELVNGRDLRHIIKRLNSTKTAMPIGFASYVIHRAAEGLDFAHRKIGVNGQPLNLVHRDVSPQNILVSYDGEVKVVDFGIAKAAVRDTETRAGVLKGKFAYMAPEQVTGGAIDRRADIFALGAVFYELLTGKKLFHGESDFSILEKVRSAKAPNMAELYPGLPAEVDAALRSALAPDVGTRFAWASDFAEALAPLLIDNRNIFGAKQAKEFMHALCADDIDLLGEQLRRYSAISEDDCDESSEQKRKPRSSQIFETRLEAIEVGADVIADGTDVGGGEQKTSVSGTHERSRSHPDARLVAATADGAGAEAASGWTGVGPAAAFGLELSDATGMMPESVRRPLSPEVGATAIGIPLRPQPYAEMRSGSFSASRSQAARNDLSSNRGMLTALVVVILLTTMVVVAIVVSNRSSRPSARATAVTEVPLAIEQVAATSRPPPATTVSAPATPPAAPAPAPTPVEAAASAPTPVAATEGAVGDAEDDDTSDDGGHKNVKNKGTTSAKHGYVTVKANGVKAARVYVNGKEAGYSPVVFYKVKLGNNSIKIVEDVDGEAGRVKVLDVVVVPSHTRKDPLKLVVSM